MGGCRGCCSCIGVSPMDENSPLSPKANAFSIASLISVAAAAEQAGKGALEERGSAPARPGCRPQKMHFSTVTRDMEGERRARPRGAAGTGPPSHRLWECFHTSRPGGRAGGARPARGAARRGFCRVPRHARALAALPWSGAPVAASDGSAAWTRDPSEVLEHPPTAPAVPGAAEGRGSAPAGSAAPVRPGGRGGNN